VSLFILIFGSSWIRPDHMRRAAWRQAEPLVDEAITTISAIFPGASMLFYRAALPLSRQTLSYVAG
jgi:hypothetical protein